MPNSPDTLRVLLAGVASMTRSTASKYTFLAQPGITLELRLLQPEQNFLNHLVTVRLQQLHDKCFCCNLTKRLLKEK